jgi:hypothetical protein
MMRCFEGCTNSLVKNLLQRRNVQQRNLQRFVCVALRCVGGLQLQSCGQAGRRARCR